jgi:hypothetical protein
MRAYSWATEEPKPKWQSGAWIWWYGKRRRAIRFEWSIPTPHWGLTLNWRDGDGRADVVFMFACGLFAVWITLGDFLRYKSYDPLMPRKIGVTFHDDSIWWFLWQPINEWSRKHPRWWGGYVDIVALLLGRQKYSTQPAGHGYGCVRMPEGEYPCLVEFERARWKRPRWPFALEIVRATVTPHTPIPVPGKGSASYNCGEDAIHSTTCPASSVAEAIAAITKSVLTTRERYGGTVDWMPNEAAER